MPSRSAAERAPQRLGGAVARPAVARRPLACRPVRKPTAGGSDGAPLPVPPCAGVRRARSRGENGETRLGVRKGNSAASAAASALVMYANASSAAGARAEERHGAHRSPTVGGQPPTSRDVGRAGRARPRKSCTTAQIESLSSWARTTVVSYVRAQRGGGRRRGAAAHECRRRPSKRTSEPMAWRCCSCAIRMRRVQTSVWSASLPAQQTAVCKKKNAQRPQLLRRLANSPRKSCTTAQIEIRAPTVLREAAADGEAPLRTSVGGGRG